MTGTWIERWEPNFHVDTVEEQCAGELPPPVSAKEVYYACGKSLGRPIKAPMDKHNEVLNFIVNDYMKHSVEFYHERFQEGREG